MSGIYIKGMEMPKSCYKCYLKQRNGMDIVCPVANERFSVTDVNILEYRLDNCPLVPVQPHGRLIDADEACKRFPADADPRNGYMLYKLNNELPAIIPPDQPVMFYPQVHGITPTVILDKEG